MSHDPGDWTNEMDRAIEEHDPSREPYASMTRDEIFALMEDASLGVYEYERLRQHFLDKLTTAELERDNFMQELAMWLMDRRGANGWDQMKHCQRVAIEATARIFDDMPAHGPLHEIN